MIVVADSTKFGRRSLAHLCELGDVQRMIVDAEITDDWRAQVEKAGVELIIAEAER